MKIFLSRQFSPASDKTAKPAEASVPAMPVTSTAQLPSSSEADLLAGPAAPTKVSCVLNYLLIYYAILSLKAERSHQIWPLNISSFPLGNH